ncbi:M20 family metallopeptidase [Pseudonocardia zijingensis]|uniref:Amidohydrolase n=1 Tax=Pseudonocardia zijingensis TaxID=153376 RepID=A0ABP3YL30_9PSEU
MTADVDLPAEVARVEPLLVAVRREVHEHPELAFEEFRTAALVADRCAELGHEVRSGVGRTGVLAELDSGRPGPVLLVRADMDALPVQEADDDRVSRSAVPGVMHACGHDGHVAVALGVVEVLSRLPTAWSGRVRMCFQPAEETDAGAAAMIADGALDGVDLAVGLHLQSGIAADTVAVGAGVQWAAADELRITVHGVGGHAGAPEGTVDPVQVGAEIALAMREIRGEPPVSVVIAQFTAGTAANVVPSVARLRGTARAMGAAERDALLATVRSTCAAIAARHGAEVAVELGPHVPALVCDDGVTEQVRTRLRASFGERVVPGRPTTGTDDMARFLAEVPGCYFRVGTGTDTPHHHPRFDLDERALPVATLALTEACLSILGG